MTSLAVRDKQPEMLDQPGVEIAQHVDALRGLYRINWISGSARILWRPIRELANEKSGRPLRVLDLATGGGDVPIRLFRRAKQAGLPITFAGVDISPVAIDYARRQALHAKAAVDFFTLDALGALPTDYDVITCSLFLHHLETDQAIEFLRRIAHATKSMILINDLVRSRLGYLLAWAGTRVLSASPIVHEDGLKSVRAAFTLPEARLLAGQAGLAGATVAWRWPFRYLLRWRRHE